MKCQTCRLEEEPFILGDGKVCERCYDKRARQVHEDLKTLERVLTLLAGAIEAGERR